MARDASKNIKTAETAEIKAEVGQVQDQTLKEEKKTSQESVYSLQELVENAKKVFGTKPECVAAALLAANKTECTVSEAKEIVNKFLKKEVK